MKVPSLTGHDRRVPLVLAFVGTLLSGRELRAQDPGGAVVGDVTADSAEVREEAETAQAAFERARIRLLPSTWSGPPHPCDEIVGRFCFWHDHARRWTPPPEHPDIPRERARLLDQLASAARVLPRDGWIVGQRVRYLIEAGRPSEAVAVAGECLATPWWCRALEGYALHSASDFAGAEVAFDRALVAMPEPERARWTDLELLLDRDLARVWKRLAPGARDAFARRLWWLADPFWSITGNERRSEHFTRLVLDRLQERARSPYDVAWGRDLGELTVRFGWPIGWERVRTSSGVLGGDVRPAIVGHDAAAGRPFVPPNAVFGEPLGTRAGEWRLQARAPRETYAPAYADSVVDLEPLIAIFRRGDSARVVAGWSSLAFADRRAPVGGPTGHAQVHQVQPPQIQDAGAVLVAARDPDAEPTIVRAVGSASGPLEITVAWASTVLSLEAHEGPFAGRARFGLPIDELGRPLLSDLLMLDRPAPLPGDLDEAAHRARGSNRVRPGERLGLYFEIYPPAGSEGIAEISIALRDDRGGFWRGLASALGMGSRSSGVATAWSEPFSPGAPVHPRAVVVELSGLSPGAYTLVLAVSLPGGPAHQVERPIQVFDN
jgi:hypothetical protein